MYYLIRSCVHVVFAVGKFVPSHKVHPLTFKGWRKHSRRINRLNWSCLLHNRVMVRNKDKYQRVIGALIKKERRKGHRLKELGIDYDFPGYVSCSSAKEVNQNKVQCIR
ncbi:MKI67 FHA domain-interacting nucleolar phosphoprotein-like isoform X2 [Dysidea avara]|uniref:MKI67 FHA domain-interacting nucleolar phosphoprotein-like isoform X2 n=1 Tax=Dysidea avara TaxID=196820 RepID=UPI003317CFDF